VNAKIPIPDMRVEYETRDLEYASLGSGIGDTRLQAAGHGGKSLRGLLALWALGGRIAFARVLDDAKITAAILNL